MRKITATLNVHAMVCVNWTCLYCITHHANLRPSTKKTASSRIRTTFLAVEHAEVPWDSKTECGKVTHTMLYIAKVL